MCDCWFGRKKRDDHSLFIPKTPTYTPSHYVAFTEPPYQHIENPFVTPTPTPDENPFVTPTPTPDETPFVTPTPTPDETITT